MAGDGYLILSLLSLRVDFGVKGLLNADGFVTSIFFLIILCISTFVITEVLTKKLSQADNNVQVNVVSAVYIVVRYLFEFIWVATLIGITTSEERSGLFLVLLFMVKALFLFVNSVLMFISLGYDIQKISSRIFVSVLVLAIMFVLGALSGDIIIFVFAWTLMLSLFTSIEMNEKVKVFNKVYVGQNGLRLEKERPIVTALAFLTDSYVLK